MYDLGVVAFTSDEEDYTAQIIDTRAHEVRLREETSNSDSSDSDNRLQPHLVQKNDAQTAEELLEEI